MSHEWDKFDKTSLEFIAGMNYQRFLSRRPEIGDKIYICNHEDDYRPFETELIFSNLTEYKDYDPAMRELYSITNMDEVKNIDGKFYCFYDNWERIK